MSAQPQTAPTLSELQDAQDRLRIVLDSARDFLKRGWSTKAFREIIDGDTGYSARLWQEVCRLGWPGMMIAEEFGGSEGNFLEVAGLIEACGTAIAPLPLAASVVAADLVAHCANDAARRELLPGAASGEAPLALALREPALSADRMKVALEARADGAGFVVSGSKLFVPYANAAAHLVVVARLAGELALLAVPTNAPGVSLVKLNPLDWSALFEVKFDGVKLAQGALLARGAEATALLAEALIKGDTLIGCEMAGACQSALDLAAAYANDRVAFGRPIGQFQGIKHKLVNLLTDLEVARALIRVATQDVALADPKRRVAAAHLAFWCTDKLKKVPEGCLQVFGGIGFTWEHDIHLYLRRVATLASLLGEQSEYREIVANHLDSGAL
jgi:alkylation response protein AidB-like acyl-CoA dehydrogenase